MHMIAEREEKDKNLCEKIYQDAKGGLLNDCCVDDDDDSNLKEVAAQRYSGAEGSNDRPILSEGDSVS